MYDITTHQAKYLANYLTSRLPANDINKLTASLQDAQVDLTPHQVKWPCLHSSPLCRKVLFGQMR